MTPIESLIVRAKEANDVQPIPPATLARRALAQARAESPPVPSLLRTTLLAAACSLLVAGISILRHPQPSTDDIFELAPMSSKAPF